MSQVKEEPRWSMIDNNTWDMILGKSGKLPGALAPEIIELAKEKGLQFTDEDPQTNFPDQLDASPLLHSLSDIEFPAAGDGVQNLNRHFSRFLAVVTLEINHFSSAFKFHHYPHTSPQVLTTFFKLFLTVSAALEASHQFPSAFFFSSGVMLPPVSY